MKRRGHKEDTEFSDYFKNEQGVLGRNGVGIRSELLSVLLELSSVTWYLSWALGRTPRTAQMESRPLLA